MNMDSLLLSLLLSLLAGATIPLGAYVASIEHIRPLWLESEFRHGVIAFGGGALLAAVSLVLVPEGVAELSLFWIVTCFSAGGVVFFLIDRLIARRGGAGGQVMAMLLDFIPEAIALGAALATGKPVGFLLALLIAMQNFPEGFNAYREISAGSNQKPKALLACFFALALFGPAAAFLGHQFLADSPALIGGVMLFAASGIIYLTFEDIAPQAVLQAHWAPPLGAVAGFLLGLVGSIVIS